MAAASATNHSSTPWMSQKKVSTKRKARPAMTDRYEFIRASDAPIGHCDPGETRGYDTIDPGNYGLVVGDAGSCALVVLGTPRELVDFVKRLNNLVADVAISAARTNRPLALRDRVRRLAEEQAAQVAGDIEMTNEDWLSCVALAGFPSWEDKFGVTGGLSSDVDGMFPMDDVLLPIVGAPTVGEQLLRELGVDPEPNDPSDLPATVRLWFNEEFSEAWHAALVDAARTHLTAAEPWWTWPGPEPKAGIREDQWEQLKCRARELGIAHGRADAENFPIAGTVAAKRILAHLAHDEPDDELASALPIMPLSGEHSGNPTPASLYRVLGVDAGVDSAYGELCQVFEEAHTETLMDTVTARCRALLGRGIR